MQTILTVFDFLGTIAFAISGALVAIKGKMDLFGVIVLSIVTATGGGVLRDLIIGDTPPVAFRNPTHVALAAFTGFLVFLFMFFHPHLPRRVTAAYDRLLFTFDTLGIAAFTVDGIILGIRHGFLENLFLLLFLGVITGVGGGVLRDILAAHKPDILIKHVYALASLLGGLLTGLSIQTGIPQQISMLAGFSFIVLLRILAAHFKWNLPHVHLLEEEGGK